MYCFDSSGHYLFLLFIRFFKFDLLLFIMKMELQIYKKKLKKLQLNV